MALNLDQLRNRAKAHAGNAQLCCDDTQSLADLVTNLSAQIDDATKAHASELDALVKKAATLAKQLSDASSDNAAYAKQVEQLRLQVKAAQDATALQKKANDDLKKQLDDSQKATVAATKQVADLTAQLTAIQDTPQWKAAQKAALQAKKDAAEKAAKEAAAELAKIQ